MYLFIHTFAIITADYKIDCFVIARNKAEGDLTFPSEKLSHNEGYI